jgi:hypothetical protein
MLPLHLTPLLTCTRLCSARDVAGFEAIRSGKEWKGLADGLISGVVLGAAWKGVSIVSDKAGLTKQVSLLLPGPVHAYKRVWYQQQQCHGAATQAVSHHSACCSCFLLVGSWPGPALSDICHLAVGNISKLCSLFMSRLSPMSPW